MNIRLHAILKDLLVPIILSVICSLITLAGPGLTDQLRYDSVAIKAGELWRLLTPHFVHLNWSHLALNMGGLYLTFFFFRRCLPWYYWLITFLSSALIISLCIFWFNPEIRWYVGMSGVLHALFMAGGLADILKRKWEGILFCGMISAKLTYEQTFGALPGSEQAAGGPVLVDAHLYGAIVGAIIGLFFLFKNRW